MPDIWGQTYGQNDESDDRPDPNLEAYTKEMMAPNAPSPPAMPTSDADKQLSVVAQEVGKIGPPMVSRTPWQGMGSIAQMTAPQTPDEAIGLWREKNIDVRPTPGFSAKIKRYAAMRTYEFLVGEGLISKGAFSSHLSDELIQEINGGFMYVGAGMLGEITTQDAQETMVLAMESYGNQVVTRATTKINEIVANHTVPGVNARQASRQTLTPEGQRLVQEQEKIANAAMQLVARRDTEAMQGAFKSMLQVGQARVRKQSGVDPELARTLKLQGNALAGTEPIPQDSARFALSIQEEPSLGETGIFGSAEDSLTGPGRLMARTTEVFKDIEDPSLALRQLTQHFDQAVNRARALRIGANPDASASGMLLVQFPNIGQNVGDVKVRAELAQSIQGSARTNVTAYERELRLARRRRLSFHVEEMMSRSTTMREELERVEARKSISFLTDAETAFGQGVGTLFEALAEGGTTFREALLRPGNVRRELTLALTGDAALEAMQAAGDAADEWATERTLAQTDPGDLQVQVGTGRGATMGRARPPVPPAVMPLRDDYSNLRAVLITAQRAGEMPYSLRKALYSDDPNDMVANAAIWASDVMAPGTVLKMLNNGMGIPEIQANFKVLQRHAFEERVFSDIPGPDSLVGTESVEDLLIMERALTARLSKHKGIAAIGRLASLDLYSLAVIRTQRGWKEAALAFVDEPRLVFDTLAGATPAVVGGSALLLPVATRARVGLLNAALHGRLRRALSDTARFDPSAVHAARKQVAGILKKIGEGGGDATKKMVKRQETYRAVATLMETIGDEHGTLGSLVKGNAPEAKKMNSAVRKLRRTLNKLGTDDLKDLSDGMGMPLQALMEAQQNGNLVVSGIQSFAGKLQEYFNIDGHSVRTWTNKNAPSVAKSLKEVTDLGGSADWQDMPFSLDAAASKPTVYQRFRNRLGPKARKVVDASGEYAALIFQWVAHKMDDTTHVRHLSAEIRGNQTSMIALLRKKYEGELADLEVAAPTKVLEERRKLFQQLDAEEEAILGAKGQLQERVRSMDSLESTLERTWDSSVNMSSHKALNDLSDADLIMWGREQGAGGNVHEFWKQNRRVGETFENFNARLNRIMAGIDKPDDSIPGLRRSITRRYLNSPGLSTKQRFDTQGAGLPLTAREAARLRVERGSAKKARARVDELQEEIKNTVPANDAERKALTNRKRALRDAEKRARFDDPAFLDEVLDTHLGIRTEDLKTGWRDLVNLSETEDALSLSGKISRAQDMTTGRISDIHQRMRDTRETLLFNQRAFAMQNNALFKRFNNLTPDEQNLYNAALSESADIGTIKPLRELAKDNDNIAGMLGALEKDKDKIVQRLLDDSNHFRQNTLRDMFNAGLLDEGTVDSLVGPYAAHLYSSGEHKTLLGSQFGPSLANSVTQGGLDMSEMMRQAHHKQWKAIVSVRGGRSITHLAPDEATLKARIESEYGTRGSYKKIRKKDGSFEKGIVEGKTGLEDPVAILEPIGPERAAQLGFLGEGTSTFLRMGTLVRDMTQAHLLKQMDRPGWALTEKQYKLRTGPEAEKGLALQTRDQFVLLDDTRQNGALRGKYVHRNVANEIEDMNRALRGATRTGDALRKLGEQGGMSARAISAGLLGIGATTAKMKQAIVQSKIVRSVETFVFNFIMDSEMFGVAAAGRDFSLLHPRAVKNKGLAARDLAGQLMGENPRPEFVGAVRRGALDDSLISHNIDPDIQKTFREGYFGPIAKTELGKRAKEAQFAAQRAAQGFSQIHPTIAKMFDDIVGKPNDPRIQKLHDEYARIVKAEKNLVDPADAAQLENQRLAISSLLEKQEPGVYDALALSLRALNRVVIGDKKTGLFRDVDGLERELYGRVANINRLGAYYHLLDKGINPDEAIRRINMFMQNYSRVPAIIRDIGKSPVGSPIVAFPYEMMRITKNMIMHKPGTLMGFMGGFSAANFMTMVGAGINPYDMAAQMEADNAGFPTFMAFASSFVVPGGDGTFSTVQLPALNWWQLAREPFGVQAKMFGINQNSGFFEKVGKGLASKFALSNPVLSTIYAGMNGLDPKTGQVMAENESFLGKASKEMGELLMPPEIPFIGSISRDIANGVEKPGYVRSGREISVAQRTFQSILGVRIRGSLGTGRVLGPLGEGMAKFLGVEAWTDLPVRNKIIPGFNDKDLYASLYVASRTLDPQNALSERVNDAAFQDLRKAQDLIHSDDPLERDAGLSMRDAAMVKYEQALDPFKEFSVARTDQERAQLLTRAYTTQNFEAQFDRLSIARKTMILIGATMAGANMGTWRALAARTSADEYGALRTYSGVLALRQAKKDIDAYLENPMSANGFEELVELQANIELWLGEAEIEHEIQVETDEYMREAINSYYGGNQ